MQLRALCSTVFSITILAVAAGPAMARATKGGATGGVSAVSAPASPSTVGGAAPTGKTPATKRHTAPVTSRSASLVYKGPVYQKSATGQIVPYQAPLAPEAIKALTGGSPAAGTLANNKPELLVPGHTARVIDGLAAAPMLAPTAVQEMIWAGNQIIGLPYIYGGGHASFSSPGYDCSGTVSFALHGVSVLASPEDSSEFMYWGARGVGTWVTLFSNPGHVYMTVAGLRLDTSSADDPSNQQGPRWRPLRPANSGFTVRHPAAL